MLKKKVGDTPSITITEEDERLLLDPDDLDAGSPEYFSQFPDQPSTYNVVEVIVLGQGGLMLRDYEKTYYPVHRVQSWMRKHCAVTGE
jgi:hypothetical protein